MFSLRKNPMNSRWEQINRIYDVALEVAEEERPAFLERNCQDDGELRREVESLFAYDKPAQQFINQPALQLTAEKLASEPPSLLGRKLGPYQILATLGAGGMGEVYKARDTRLNRTVAIKVLPRHLSERADLRQRLEREARAIAKLNHPQICALYDIGREEGIDFLVMEYLEGETLSARLKKGPLPTEQLLRTAIEIGTGSGPSSSTRRDSSGSKAGQHHADEDRGRSCWILGWRKRSTRWRTGARASVDAAGERLPVRRPKARA